MGGNGSFASGINKPYNRYEEVGFIDGIKVLKGIQGHHKLPEESRASRAYIRLKDDQFYEMRFYNENHKIKLEIAYHPEPKLSGNYKEKVLHIHEYTNGDFKTRTTRLMTNEEIKKYKKYLKGVDL